MLYAWAYGLDAPKTEAALAKFPGLGAVLYPENYQAKVNDALAFLPSPGALTSAMVTRKDWSAFIYLDERNWQHHYLSPQEYQGGYDTVRKLAQAIPVYGMGLRPVGAWWRQLLWCLKFDDTYYRQLRLERSAFNPNKVRLGEVERVLRAYPGLWLLSPAPFRRACDRWREPVHVPMWLDLAQKPNVDVALWSLVEAPDQRGCFGLLDADMNYTVVGRAVAAGLKGE